jgi:type II secretory pathway pseudopilin PulG
MNDAAQPLDRAHQLIEDGELEAAQDILATIRDDYEDDPDFWWVYAHAVEDETTGREALERVQELQPDYPGLGNLSQQMSIETPSRIDDMQEAVSAEQPPAPPDLPSDDSFDEFDDFVNELDQPEAETESSGGNRSWLIGLVAILIIVIVAAVFLLSGQEQPDDIVEATSTSPATQIVQQAVTEDADTPPTQSPVEQLTAAAAERTPAATVPPATESEADSDSDTLADALSEFNVPSDGTRTEDTSAGTTLVITVCALPGPQASTAISGILDVLADREAQLDNDTDAVGFAVTNCDTETVIRVLAVERDILQEYAAGDISNQDVQRQIRPVN